MVLLDFVQYWPAMVVVFAHELISARVAGAVRYRHKRRHMHKAKQCS